MAATAAEVESTGFVANGPRRFEIQRDLAGVADLIELCFAATMDEAGRAAIREMRMVSRHSTLMRLAGGIDYLLGGIEDGLVWVEDGKIVGNVSIARGNYPLGYGKGFLIANVAVHPAYRQRGMARQMMDMSLDLIRKKGGRFATLQVDQVNETARHLYKRLGFREERTFVRWVRPTHYGAMTKLTDMPYMTLRSGDDWKGEYLLAQLVRPDEQGGMGWQRPVLPTTFRPSIRRTLRLWATGQSEQHFVVRATDNKTVLGVLIIQSQFGGPDRLDVLIHPMVKGQLEEPLLNYAVRNAEKNFHALMIEHPSDDIPTSNVLDRYQFVRKYTLVHMRYEVRGK